MEVAEGVHRFGTRLVNWYAVEEGGRLSLIDAGMLGHWRQLPRGLEAIGRRLDDVEAIVLTHSHVDHVGFAERARTSTRLSVHVHDGDAGSGVRKFPPLYLYWRPSSWPFLVEGLRDGLLATPRVGERVTFRDGESVDVPGRPKVVHLPGHTAGSCALHLVDRGVVFTGDALVTLDPYTGGAGPRLMLRGVQEDADRARASLSRLADVPAGVVLPGHGEPWREGAAEAVSRALSAG